MSGPWFTGAVGLTRWRYNADKLVGYSAERSEHGPHARVELDFGDGAMPFDVTMCVDEFERFVTAVDDLTSKPRRTP